jgi:dolichol-phosphate mannosyltransferase
VRIGEVGYTFRDRLRGESKLDIVVGLEYLQLLLDKVMRGRVPGYAFLRLLPLSFDLAQAIASFLVIALNFALNNLLTFRADRLRGKRAAQGLLLFYVACSVGLVFNLGAAHGLRDFGLSWYSASLVGVIIGSVWNYWVTSLFIWEIGRHRADHLWAVSDPGYPPVEIRPNEPGSELLTSQGE